MSALVAFAAVVPLELLIPMYIYPTWWLGFDEWEQVAAEATAPMVVVVNADDGPGVGGPNVDYEVGTETLRDVGITQIGYVYTGYGTRSVLSVIADIHQWSDHWVDDGISGIFVDEVSTDPALLSYYDALADYVRAQPGLGYVVLNPGLPPANGYYATSDSVVVFEDDGATWSTTTAPSAPNMAVLAHGVPDTAGMQAAVEHAVRDGASQVYVTDDVFAPNPWDTLPSYWNELAATVRGYGTDPQTVVCTALQPGGSTTCTAEHAMPGARVFAVAGTPGQTCPGVVDHCLGVRSIRLVGSSTVSDLGTASVTFSIPLSVATGVTLRVHLVTLDPIPRVHPWHEGVTTTP